MQNYQTFNPLAIAIGPVPFIPMPGKNLLLFLPLPFDFFAIFDASGNQRKYPVKLGYFKLKIDSKSGQVGGCRKGENREMVTGSQRFR